MKKFRILPLIAIATLTGITLPVVVSCNKGGGDTPEEEYDIIDETDDEHIEVAPTKFKLNQELVISYTLDEDFSIDKSQSFVIVGQKVWQVKELQFGDKSVILSADKVDSNTITVKFVSLDLLNSPLCFTGVSNDNVDSTVSCNADQFDRENVNIETSTDKINWSDWNGSPITLSAGQKLYVRNTKSTLSGANKFFKFSMTGLIESSGNVNSLINYSDITDYCFCRLFAYCDNLISAPELPSTTLNKCCYIQMFMGCTSLTQAPDLPATTLADSCYEGMFQDCTSLTQAPYLPALTLPWGSYYRMFRGCSGLEKTPIICATNLGNRCCYEMFFGCDGLQVEGDWFLKNIFNKQDEMTFQYGWAWNMFSGAYKGDVPFTLPQPTYKLRPYCFSGLNSGLSITTIPNDYLPWTELANDCYEIMFMGCGYLTTATYLPANKLANYCYSWMFADCSSLEVNEVQTNIGNDDNRLIFNCPDTTGLVGSVSDMFTRTKEHDTEFTPQDSYSYYWVE